MQMQFRALTGAVTLVISAAATAQTQPAAPTVAPQSPAQTKTTTTQSTTSTAVVPDTTTGGVAAQKTTETTSTTTTEPVNGTPQSATSQTTSTTTVKPDEPGAATTTTTTTTQPAVAAATAADVKAAAPVFDSKGGVVGKVESVSAKGAVVTTGKARALIPVSSFGKNDKGLVITMTKAEIEAAAPAKATSKKK